MVLASALRYGENPHQPAAFYLDRSLAEAGKGGVAGAVLHHGKEMSYNNYLDADAAYGAVCDYAGAASTEAYHAIAQFLIAWKCACAHPL